MREKDNTARRLPAFEHRAPIVVPLRRVTRAPSAWERCKMRVRTMIHHERFGESVFLVLTLLLVCTLCDAVARQPPLPRVNQVRTDRHPPDGQRARAMGDEVMVTGVDRLATHTVTGSTPVTRSRESKPSGGQRVGAPHLAESVVYQGSVTEQQLNDHVTAARSPGPPSAPRTRRSPDATPQGRLLERTSRSPA
jgi:hypothetical protein